MKDKDINLIVNDKFSCNIIIILAKNKEIVAIKFVKAIYFDF
jgi:hypothetical protein